VFTSSLIDTQEPITMVDNDGNAWTPAILKQYVDQRFLDSDKANVLALQAAEKAVAKAEVATDKRFDALADDADRRARDLSVQISALQTDMHHREGSKAEDLEHREITTNARTIVLSLLGSLATAAIIISPHVH
jgi:hypothetical protein